MSAAEAAELTLRSRATNLQLSAVLGEIHRQAEKGKFETYFTDLTVDTKDELRKLGYIVTSYFARNESSDTISWWGVELK